MQTITISDRTVVLVDSGCDINPKVHCVWLGQISPTFAAVLGGCDDDAIEEAADAIEYKATSMEDMNRLANEMLVDCNGDEEKAWDTATDGAFGLNGGAEWIDADEWGFWTPRTKDDAKQIADALRALRNDSFAD
jgi:hypothetical protein